jgi:hypothetical protein
MACATASTPAFIRAEGSGLGFAPTPAGKIGEELDPEVAVQDLKYGVGYTAADIEIVPILRIRWVVEMEARIHYECLLAHI